MLSLLNKGGIGSGVVRAPSWKGGTLSRGQQSWRCPWGGGPGGPTPSPQGSSAGGIQGQSRLSIRCGLRSGPAGNLFPKGAMLVKVTASI